MSDQSDPSLSPHIHPTTAQQQPDPNSPPIYVLDTVSQQEEDNVLLLSQQPDNVLILGQSHDSDQNQEFSEQSQGAQGTQGNNDQSSQSQHQQPLEIDLPAVDVNWQIPSSGISIEDVADRIDRRINALFRVWSNVPEGMTLEEFGKHMFQYPVYENNAEGVRHLRYLSPFEEPVHPHAAWEKYSDYTNDQIAMVWYAGYSKGCFSTQSLRQLEAIEDAEEQGIERADNNIRAHRKAKIRNVFEMAFHAYTVMHGQSRYRLAQADSEVELDAPDVLISLRFQHLGNAKVTLTGYQDYLLFLLDKTYMYDYRRYADCVYTEVIYNGHRTHAWKRLMTIEAFVWSAVKKETNYNMWVNVTKSAKHVIDAIKYLQNCVDVQFPELKKDRNVFSFTNGVYVADQADQQAFYPYPANLPEHVVACNWIPKEFYDYSAEEVNGDWYNIPTPYFQQILAYQGLSHDVCKWMYILLGRVLYPVNQHDGWQVIPFIKGTAGSGKSTICGVAKSFYDASDVGVMANNIEKQFGLSQLLGVFLFIAPEIKRDFGLDQAEFQSIVSGEDIAVAAKFQTAKRVEWDIPGVLAGNEVPDWIDNSGSLSRRNIVFHFPKKVIDGDPNLKAKLRDELPAMIKKCNVAYSSAQKTMADRDIWTVLPEYFKEKQRELTEACNALQSFLSSDAIEKDPHNYVPQQNFIKAFKEYAFANGYPMSKWNGDYYNSIFMDHDIKMEKASLVYPRNTSNVKVGDFIIGCDLTINLPPAPPPTEPPTENT